MKKRIIVCLLIISNVMMMKAENAEMNVVNTATVEYSRQELLSHLESLTEWFENDTIVVPDTNALVALEERYPSDSFYKGIWTSSRLNPYEVGVDEVPDSLTIDVSNFHYPTKSNHVTSNFGSRGWRYHYGTDIGLHYGDTIYAAFDGVVRMRRYERRGYGHYVVIRHNNKLETIYGHMSRVLVKRNQKVKAGEPIALGGSTGRSSGPHLHFEMRLLGNAFNSKKLIDYSNRTCKYDSIYVETKQETYSHIANLKAMKRAAYHRVRPGNTLSGIAKRYHTSVSRLCRLNKMNRNSILRIGQRVRYR